ncbi:translation initiation factor III, partial [Micromonospora zhanjiangensis]
MARTKEIQRPVTPRSASSRTGRSIPKPAIAGLVASGLAAFWAMAMLTSFGQILYVYLFVFTEFYAGVVVLVLLSMTVMAGLVATDRLVLMIRHRVLLQSAHRAMGTVAVGALVLHILTKIAIGRAGALDSVVPFVSGRGVYIGLGTVAGYLMVAVLWTGIVRMRFVGKGKPWMWRALHSTAYVSWPIALFHGLNAGRPPATWVVVSYLVCVLGVVATMIVRVSVSIGRKSKESGSTTGSLKPVGKMAEATDKVRGSDKARGSTEGATRRRPGARVSSEEGWYQGLKSGPNDPKIDSWGANGESTVRETRRRSANRFTVPEVPRGRPAEDAPPADPWSEE